MSVRVGVIGVGRMGAPICARLVTAGFAVTTGDRRPEAQHAARVAGAAWLGDPRRVAEASDVLLTVLPGSEELCQVMEAILPSLGAGQAWIDMTSAAPQRAAAPITAALQRGVECLVATLGGGPAQAAAGTLALLAGGDAAAVERHRPLLEALGRVEHVGDPAAAHLAKLLVNLLWFGQAIATAEALLLARRAGVDLDRLVPALQRSAAGEGFVRRDLPGLLDGDYLDSFGLDRCCEELDAVVALARQHAVPHELAATVARTYGEALTAYGPVDGELRGVALLEERAGTRLRRRSAGDRAGRPPDR